MNDLNNLSESVIFSKGEKITNDYFIGTVWLKMLVNDNDFNCPIYNVTFEPGARNSWHKHPGGQILLVTDGVGYYQERGKQIQLIKKGDVILIHPDIEHWHGAAPESPMTHIGITTNIQKGDAVWLEPVSNNDYYSLK